MKYVVRLAPPAVRQIERIVAWWESNRIENPDQFQTELIALLSSLGEFPFRGAPIPRSRPRSTRRRLLVPRTDYRITYDVLETTHEVLVIRVASARRRS